MSLVGNLEDLGLGEILQIVSLSRKSGVLRLNSRGRLGEIAFRQGKVIRASSSSFQESLGELLIRKGLIDLATLRGALALQEREGFQERLGLILIRQYGVAAAAIDEVVREQFEKVVYSLFAWVEGTFDFELQENVEAVDNIRMDPMQFMLDQGLNPQFLAMEGARLIDEQRHRGVLPPAVAPHAAVPPLAGMEDPPDSGQTRSQPDAAAKAEEPVSLVLVDDDDLTRETLAAALEQGGYRVYQQERSEDALIRIDSLYRKGKRPVVLADLIMPRMDGTGILGGLNSWSSCGIIFPTSGYWSCPTTITATPNAGSGRWGIPTSSSRGEPGWGTSGKPTVFAVICWMCFGGSGPASSPLPRATW